MTDGDQPTLDLSQLRNDPERETEGVWETFSVHPLGGRQLYLQLRIARFQNPEHKKRSRMLGKKHRAVLRRADLDDPIYESIITNLMAATIWNETRLIDLASGDTFPIQLEPGKPFTDTQDERLAILRDPRFRDIYDFAFENASRGGSAWMEEIADAGKG